MPKYNKVWRKKKGYSYKNKKGEKISVDPHKQRYRVRVYEDISRNKAVEVFNKRSKRAKTIDKANRAKNTKSEPDEEWLENMNRVDVEGIDAPPYIDEVLDAREKGMKLVNDLLEIDPDTSLSSSLLSREVPEFSQIFDKLSQGDIVFTIEDIEKLEARFEDQWKLRELREFVESIEEVNKLKTRQKLLRERTGEGGRDMNVTKFNEETYQILKNALGTGEPLQSEDIVSTSINNMSEITGPSRTYGLSRSWLGSSEYGKPTEYEANELDRLHEGAIIERNTGNSRKLYRKVDGEWYLIAKRERGGAYTLKGVIPEAIASEGDQAKLDAIVQHSDDLSARMLAINNINDKDILENIAASDESYRMRSRAYHRLKELDPDSSKLASLREHYQRSKELQAEQRRKSEKAYFEIYDNITYFKPKKQTIKKIDKHIQDVSETSDIDALLAHLRTRGGIDKSLKKRFGKALLKKIPRNIDEQTILKKIQRKDRDFYELITS